MRRTRITYVITDLDVGGVPLHLARLATALPRDRFAVQVISLADRGPVGQRLAAAGIRVDACDARGISDVAALGRLWRLLRAARPDVLHALLFHANVAARLVGPLAGIACDRIICEIQTVEIERTWHLPVDGMTCRWCRFTVGNSAAVIGHLHRCARIPQARLQLMTGGVDVVRFDDVAPLDRGSIGLPSEEPIVLWVGRMDPVKGLDTLVDAAVHVRRERAAQFVLVGGGPEEARVRQRIRAADAGSYVRLLGHRDDIPALLAAADLFVLPSRTEGLPNAVLEAMAAGKAIVASAVGGCRELIESGRDGRLVRPNDPRELANAILELLGDSQRRVLFGRAARAKVAVRYNWSRRVADWIATYTAMADRRSCRAPGRMSHNHR